MGDSGVDLYVGGGEHAVLHLLYARFWHKVLFDHGYVSTPEPFKRLFHQGLIMGEDGRKMSKSLGNVVNPDEVIASHGADALRLYEMFLGPLEASKPWNTAGIDGIARHIAIDPEHACKRARAGDRLIGRIRRKCEPFGVRAEDQVTIERDVRHRYAAR